jgi:hypothetical protein
MAPPPGPTAVGSVEIQPVQLVPSIDELVESSVVAPVLARTSWRTEAAKANVRSQQREGCAQHALVVVHGRQQVGAVDTSRL